MPVKFRFIWTDEALKLHAGWLFLWFDISPDKMVERFKSQKLKTENPKKLKKEKKRTPKKKKRSITDTLDTVLTLMRNIERPWDILRSRIVFSRIRIYLVISGDDAYLAAINYSKCSAAVYGLLTLIHQTFRLRRHKIVVQPDFAGREFRDISGRVHLRPIFAVAAGLYLLIIFLFTIIKNRPVKIRGGRKYEPATSRK